MALGVLYEFQTMFGTSGDTKLDFIVCTTACVCLIMLAFRAFIDVIKK